MAHGLGREPVGKLPERLGQFRISQQGGRPDDWHRVVRREVLAIVGEVRQVERLDQAAGRVTSGDVDFSGRERAVDEIEVHYAWTVTKSEPVSARQAIEAVGFGDSDVLRLEDAAEGHPLVMSGLSGGELQRLALARALVLKPDWLFLDEATSALDEAAEADLFAMLKKHLPATTFVIVSHCNPKALGTLRVIDLEPKAEAANENPVLQFA